MRVKIIFLIALSLSCLTALSQKFDREYIIISYEETYKHAIDGHKIYHWIISDDSLISYDANLSRLFLEGFSVNDLENCLNGNPIDPYSVFRDSKFNFEEEYYQELDHLERIINKNRRRVMSVKKKWDEGQISRIEVFITPVKGKFCTTDYDPIGQERDGYYGTLSLPLSDFEFNEVFWKSSKAEYVKKRDFFDWRYDVLRQ